MEGYNWLADNDWCVFRGSILGPLLFNVFTNDLNAGLERILIEMISDAVLGGAVVQDRYEALQ